MAKKWYVYWHSTVNDCRIFYVGKGAGKRWKATSRRNAHWSRTAEKHGLICDIFHHFNHEACALSWEVAIIKYFGRKHLCNMTDGGEGMSGCSHSDQAKEKIRISKIKMWENDDYRKQQTDRVSGDKNPMFGVKGNMHHSYGNRGRSNKLYGIKRPKHSEMMSGTGHPNHDPRVFLFRHVGGDRETLTKCELRIKYNLCSSSLSKLCDGRAKTHLGWSIDSD